MIVLERTVFELQLKNDQLQLNIMDKCSEIKHLEEICCELNLTVEQFKEINRKDVSVYELDLSLSQLPPEVQSRYSEETLAETVVDVLLHEKECEVNQLQDEIGEMKMDFERVCDDLKSVQAENVTLNCKTKDLENCLSDMRISKEQVLQEKEILQTELLEKNKTIQKKDKEIEELVQSKCSQEENISNLSRVAEQTNLLLTACVNKIQELEHLTADLTMRVSENKSELHGEHKRNAWRDPCEYPLIDSFSSDEDDDDVDEFSSYFNESYDSDHALRDQCMIEEINKEMEENLSIPPDNEMCKRKHEPLRNENNNRTDELSSKELVKNSSSNKVVKTPKEIFSRDSPNTKPVVIDVPSIKRSLRSLPIPNKSRHRTVIFYDENDQVKHFWCKENEFKILFVSLMVVVVGWMFVNWK